MDIYYRWIYRYDGWIDTIDKYNRDRLHIICACLSEMSCCCQPLSPLSVLMIVWRFAEGQRSRAATLLTKSHSRFSEHWTEDAASSNSLQRYRDNTSGFDVQPECVLQGTDSLHPLLGKLYFYIFYLFIYLLFLTFPLTKIFSFDLLGSVRGACSGEIGLLGQPAEAYEVYLALKLSVGWLTPTRTLIAIVAQRRNWMDDLSGVLLTKVLTFWPHLPHQSCFRSVI